MRAWLYDRLSTDPAIVVDVADRIFSASGLTEVPDKKPFMLYRFGTIEGAEVREDNVALHERGVVNIWVYDIMGDYLRIEDIVKKVRNNLDNASTDPPFVRASWNFTSQDLQDDLWKCAMKFVRYTLLFNKT